MPFKISHICSRFPFPGIFYLILVHWHVPAHQASSQPPQAQQVPSPQAGVLLAYSSMSTHGNYEYQTAWIVFSSSDAHVVATVPDIIVPRSTGFWRLGATVACEYSAENQQDASREIIWQLPIEKTPEFYQGAPCKSHKSGFPDKALEED